MSLYTVVFSPTGGTKAVLQQLTQGWSEPPQEIDLSKRKLDFSTYSFTSRDICLIAVPSFGGRVPEAALHHLSQMHGGGAQAVLIVSYGNRAYDDTLLELFDAASGCGFCTIGAVAAVAEHSIMRQYGAGRPDAQDCAELMRFAQALAKRAAQPLRPTASLALPGARPFRPYGGVPLKPSASKRCTRCGQCEKSCPVAAIPAENPSQTNNEVCISCMRCIAVCPEKARSNPKLLLLIAGKKLAKACATRKANELFLADFPAE